jgi:hypothetical protein
MTLVASTGSFAEPRAYATTHTALVMLRAIGGLDAIEFHHESLKAL